MQSMSNITNNLQSIYRAGELISILSDMTESHSIKTISTLLDVPIEIVRADFMSIASSKELVNLFYIDDICFKEFFSHKKHNSRYFALGYYDEYTISIKNELVNNLLQTSAMPNTLLLQVTKDEFCELNPKPLHSFPECIFKNQSHTAIVDYKKVLPKIEKAKYAIQKKEPITCTQNGKHFIYYPIALYQDIISSNFYLVSTENDSIVFLQMNHSLYIEKINDKATKTTVNFDYTKTPHILSLLEYIWEPESIPLSSKPTKVKLLVKNEPNVIEKIQHDISHHKGIFTQNKDGSYLYETSVIGMNSFISWVISYGSSIVVLEPDSVKNTVIEIYEDILKKYS